MDELAHCHGEITKLATMLMEEFGGPTQNESACEMAIRVLNEQKALILDYGMQIAKLKEANRELRDELAEQVL